MNVLDVKPVSEDQKSVLQTWLSINRGSNVYAVSSKRQLQYGFMSPDEIDKSVADINAASTTARDLMKRLLAQ